MRLIPRSRIAEPDVIAKLASQGGGPAGASPKVFDNYLKDETVKWRTPAKEVNITTD